MNWLAKLSGTHLREMPMKKSTALTVLALICLPLMAHAEKVSLALGEFEISDDLVILDRKEEIDEKSGKSEGLIVFSKKGDLGRAVFIVSYLADDPSLPPLDPLDGAVKIGNPFDTSLTSKDARSVSVGGAAGGSYSGILHTGLAATSYVVAHGGYRLIVLLKGPNTKPYQKLMKEFSQALEKFVWKTTPA